MIEDVLINIKEAVDLCERVDHIKSQKVIPLLVVLLEEFFERDRVRSQQAFDGVELLNIVTHVQMIPRIFDIDSFETVSKHAGLYFFLAL